MYKKGLQGWLKHWDFILIDLIMGQLSLLLACFIRFETKALVFENYVLIAPLLLVSNFLVSVFFNSFHDVLKRGYYKEFVKTLCHCALILLGIMLYTFLSKTSADYSRFVFAGCFLIHIVLGYGTRLLYKHLRKTIPNTKNRPVLIITTKEYASEAISILQSDMTNTINILGLTITDEDMIGQEIDGIKVVSSMDTVVEYACREWISEIYFYFPQGFTKETIDLYTQLMQSGIVIHIDLNSLTMFKDMQSQMERFGKNNVLTLSINTATPLQSFMKRFLDILGGLFGSLAALLIMAIIAIPLKKQSPGPLLYKAERIGYQGKRFKMLKIRSMKLNADAQKQELMAQNRVADGMMFKLDWDPRIIGNIELPDGTRKTGIGEFIRKTSLDEFPQFFNVLKGDMSMVGPRPPTPDEWVKYNLHHRSRLATKPGITGLWQVSGRSEITDFEEVVRLDNEYISNWTPGLDWRILLKTIIVVLKGQGAM